MLVIPERDRDVLYTRRVRQKRYKLKTSNTFTFSFQMFLRCPADVNFADKRLKHVSQTSSSPKLTKDVFVTKTYGSLGCIKPEGKKPLVHKGLGGASCYLDAHCTLRICCLLYMCVILHEWVRDTNYWFLHVCFSFGYTGVC